MNLLSRLFGVCDKIDADTTLDDEQRNLLKGVQIRNHVEYRRLFDAGVIKPAKEQNHEVTKPKKR